MAQSEQSGEFPVQKSEAEWREVLTERQFHILREAGTEAPRANAYWDEKTPGRYVCAGCGQPLFDSDTKFKSGTGWPSFYDAIGSDKVALRPDGARTEVVCNRCGGHLGHLFKDAPDQPTGLRYCVNSAAMNLKPEKSDQSQSNQAAQ